MLKKAVIVMSLLTFSLLCVAFSSFDAKASNGYPIHNLDSGLSYISIQEAINAPETSNGHTIFVEAGTYYESVVVNKSVSLVGADKYTTIIEGNGALVLGIDSDGVSISSLTVRRSGEPEDSGDGLGVCSAVGNVQISDIIVRDNDGVGVHLVPGSHDINITRTIIMNNSLVNILLNKAWKVNVYNSTILSSDFSGITIHNGGNHSIIGNNITNNLADGIFLLDRSSNNTISGNTIMNNGYGIFSRNFSDPLIQSNIIALCGRGVVGSDHCKPIIEGNNITSNEVGIWLEEQSAGTIQGNIITNNNNGIATLNYSNPFIHGNIIASNINTGVCCAPPNSLSEIHWNDIYDNPWDVFNEDISTTVNATYNFWGDGPSTSSNVFYDPRLTESIFSVEVTNPLSRQAVSSTVTVSTQVNARSGVEKVDFYIDNRLESVDHDAPYEWSWDTTQYAQTEHEITAKAYDLLGLKVSKSITVFVDNTPPAVSIKAPTPHNVYNGTIGVSVSATDNKELSNVHVRVDNTEWLVMIKDPIELLWKYDLNTTILADGQHTITVLALDKAGNPTTNSTTLFTDNNPPTLVILTPQSEMIVGITLIVDVEADDVSGISRIEFYIQDVLAHTVTSIPYQWSWDTTKYPNGEYTIIVKAYDMLGKAQTREVTVTVKNVESPWWQTHFWTIIQVLIAIGGLTLGIITYLTEKRRRERKSARLRNKGAQNENMTQLPPKATVSLSSTAYKNARDGNTA